MARVGQQRQRPGQHAAHRLDQHEAENQRERNQHFAFVGAVDGGSVSMGVAMGLTTVVVLGVCHPVPPA